jgi:PST family polysaccharide transporter
MFIKNSVWLSLEKITRVVVGFVVGLAVIRYLGPEQYSLFAFALAAASMLLPLAKFGLEQLAVREFVAHSEREGSVFRTVFLLRLAFGLLCAGALATAVSFASDRVPHELILVASLYLLLQPLETADLWLQSRSLFYLGGAGRVIALLLVGAAKVYLIYVEAPLVAFVWAWLAESLLSSLWSLGVALYLRGSGLWRAPHAAPFFRFDLRENLSLIATSFLVLLYFRVDALVLPALLGKVDAGRYLAALPVVEALSFLGAIISTVMFPVLMKRLESDRRAFWDLFAASMKLATWVGIATSVVIAAASVVALPVLLGARFHGSEIIAAMLALTLPIMFQGAVVDSYIVGFRKTSLLAAKALVALVFKVALFYVLAPKYGIYGAGIATMVATAAAVAVTLAISKEVFVVQLKAFMPLRVIQSARTVMAARG